MGLHFFLLQSVVEAKDDSNDEPPSPTGDESDDGVPLDDDADGEPVPFDGAALLKGAIKHGAAKVAGIPNFGDMLNSPSK